MNSKVSLLESIQNGLSESLGKTHPLEWITDLSGGDINQAALLKSGEEKWFVKYRFNAPPGMFEAEALALGEISASGCIKAPTAIAHGSVNDTAWLLLEYLELLPGGPASLLGEQLAALHRVTGNHYGWSINNYIGTTPQHNRAYDNWMDFWRDCRLQPQLEMAANGGFGGRLIDRGERLLANLGPLLQGHQPIASLLHGDLWAGNMAYTPAGQPVIFDPASYYGDREADIAMTELFGGFETSFYSAYQSHFPLSDGYPLRRELYNLYHVLNHLNLFGATYLARSEHIIDRLLAQIN